VGVGNAINSSAVALGRQVKQRVVADDQAPLIILRTSERAKLQAGWANILAQPVLAAYLIGGTR